MIRTIRYTALVFFLSLNFAVLAQRASKQHFVIKGQVDLPVNRMVVVSTITPIEVKVIDTVYTQKNGKFTYVGQSESSQIFYLTFGRSQPPGVPLVAENGSTIKLSVDTTVGYPFEIKGGKFNEDMRVLHGIYTKYDASLRSLSKEAEQLDPTQTSPEQGMAINKRYQKLIEDRTAEISAFVDERPASPVLYFAVRFLFSKPEPKLIVRANEKMQKDQPLSEYSKEMAKLRASLGPVIEGVIAPDLYVKSVNGDSLRLSSLRGKVVLIDFWASWCGPCRQENPFVRALYEKYKDRGFEIYAISLDYEESKWKRAIAKDSLGWLHVSELQGFNSPAAQTYNVHGIPQTFLLDRDGRIHRVGLRSHQLAEELERMFSN